jgi:hypothetical protein
LERFTRFERGVDDVADLMKQVQPFVAGFQFGRVVAEVQGDPIFV